MAFNGSGTYVLPGAALVDGQTISATEHNTFRDDVATALSTCVTRNGQSPATANLPMGGFKLTGLAAGTGNGESVRFEQLIATSIVNTPAGGIAATTVQAAINELDTEKAALAGSASQVFSVSNATAAAHATAWGQLRFGQCYLSKSGANLLLSREGGSLLTINGLHYEIPSAGVTLAPPATTATLYYIYAYMNSGTMTLEASATGYAIDTTTGIPIKSGDATRTFVGLAYTVSSAWVYTNRQRLVLSYWNRKLRTAAGLLASTTATTSATPVEIFASTDRAEFLCFADDIEIKHHVSLTIGAGGTITPISWTSLDGSTTTGDAQTLTASATSTAYPMGQCRGFTTTQGFHYLTLFGQSAGGVSTSFTQNYSTVSVSFFG